MAGIMGGVAGSGSGHASLGYENPTFKIKIVAPNDSMQQHQGKPRPNSAINVGDNLREGDPITAKIGKEVLVGTISAIHKNAENDVTFVSIRDQDGKIHKVDISRVGDIGPEEENIPDNIARKVSAVGVFAESKILSFSQFSRL